MRTRRQAEPCGGGAVEEPSLRIHAEPLSVTEWRLTSEIGSGDYRHAPPASHTQLSQSIFTTTTTALQYTPPERPLILRLQSSPNMPSVFKSLRKSLSRSNDSKQSTEARRRTRTSSIADPNVRPHDSIDTNASWDSALTSPPSSNTEPSSNGSAITIPTSPNDPTYGLVSHASIDSSLSQDGPEPRSRSNRRSVFSLDLAKQAVDQIVSRAQIHVESIKVGDLTPEGFHLSMVVRVGKTGPTKAKITFPDGLDLYLDPAHTRPIANISLSPIKIKNSTRTNGLVVDGRLNTHSNPNQSASSQRGLDSLFRKLITSKGAVLLRIGSPNAEIKAYGMSFKRILLDKEISLDGLDSLGGALSFLSASVPPSSTPSTPQRSSIKNFTITGGDQKSGISFRAQVELPNPAEITARLGDIRLRLETDIDELKSSSADHNAAIGQVVLPDLTLKPGTNIVSLHGNVLVAPQGDHGRLAGVTLIRYLLENRSVHVNVVGSRASSRVPWVAAIFASVRISALLPALGISSRLLDGASLIPPDEAVLSPQPQLYARATLRNQLGPPLHIHSLWVEAFQDVEPDADHGAPAAAATRLGDIRTPADSPVLTLASDAPVHASLPFSLSAGGSSYVRILQIEAKRKGIELNENLVAALEMMPDRDGQDNLASAVSKARKGARSTSDEPLDLPNLVARALSSLKVSAHVVAQVSIGDYRIPGEINFVQRQLPIAITVKTARNILPTIGAPLVDALIDQASVSISKLKILDMDEKGLNVEAEIGLVDFGPLDVDIHFDQGLNITSAESSASSAEEPVIGRIVFAEALRGVAGSEELLKTRLRILPATGPKSMATFATFVSEIIQKEAFPIQISSDACRVVAGGATFPAVLSKSVVLPGLGGLKGLTLEGLDIFDEVAAPTGPGRGRALSSASASSGSSGHVNNKEKAFKVRTRIRIPHNGLLAVALSKIEAGIEFEGIQIGIVSAEDIVFTLTEADVRFEANGFIFLGSESFKDNQSLAEYKHNALQAFGRLAAALLGGMPVELTIRGYRAFAMGDVQILPAGRTQVPPHLRSKSSSTSIQRRESVKLVRNASLSNSNSSTFSQKQVPWLDQAFQKISISTVVHQDFQPVIRDMRISRISARFLREGTMDADIDAITFQIELPLDVRFEVLAVEADIELHCEGVGRVGTGRIDRTDVVSCTPVEPSRGDSDVDASVKTCCEVRLASGSLKLVTDSGDGLAQLIAHIADSEETDRISIRGRARARVGVALGDISVDVDLGRQPHILAIDGLRGLRSSPVQYTNLQVVEASREYLKIVFSLYLNNPSKTLQVALPDTDLTMAAFYRGAYVGRAHIPKGFSMESGPVAVHDIHFRYCPAPEMEKAVRDIPANFLSGRTTTLEIRGDDESSEIALLIPALKNIRLTFELRPMMDRTLIDSISITLGVTALTSASVDAEFVVNNPLGVPFDLCTMSFMATYKGKPFGSCTVSYERDHPLRVPAGSVKQPGQQQSSPVTVALAQPLEDMVGAFLKSKGELLLDIEVNARVEIQGFKIPNFNYRQPQLPLTIKGLEGLSKWMRFLP